MNEKLKYANQQVLDGESVESKYKYIENELKNQLFEVKEKCKKDVENMEIESKTKMLQLEAEVQKQRERTIGMVVGQYLGIFGPKSGDFYPKNAKLGIFRKSQSQAVGNHSFLSWQKSIKT